MWNSYSVFSKKGEMAKDQWDFTLRPILFFLAAKQSLKNSLAESIHKGELFKNTTNN